MTRSIAVCPGSFDPVTNGHVDVVERAAPRFDELVVAVVGNPSKSSGRFPIPERLELLETAIGHVGGVRVVQFDGLLVELCAEVGAGTIVKGLRAVADFEYEVQMAQMNRRVADVETMFLATAPAWSYVSSSLVAEVHRLGGDVEGLVPPHVLDALDARS